MIRIKGFRSRLNEIRLYHLQLFKRRHLDERKTLTKVSTRKPLTNIPQTKSAHLGMRKPGKEYANRETGKRSQLDDTAKTSKKQFA